MPAPCLVSRPAPSMVPESVASLPLVSKIPPLLPRVTFRAEVNPAVYRQRCPVEVERTVGVTEVVVGADAENSGVDVGSAAVGICAGQGQRAAASLVSEPEPLITPAYVPFNA